MNLLKKGLRKMVHKLGESRLLSPQHTIRSLYRLQYGKWPDLKCPKGFNEKLIWMLYNTDISEWSRLADKYQVRKFVAEKGYAQNLVPLLLSCDSADDIDFHTLPDSFVIKSNNGSGQNIIVKDKSEINAEDIRKRIQKWSHKPFGLSSGEIHYINIPPKIIIEELLPGDGEHRELPVDYKFYCFNGKVEVCMVLTNRNIKDDFYNLNMMDPISWEDIPDVVLNKYHGDPDKISKPASLPQMISMAQHLSEGFPFVRVDLYDINGKPYFGELTFTPAACRQHCLSREYLISLGKKLII